jgi:molybdenum cofactor cytidylyltransferase
MMEFGEVPIGQAEGAVLAHSVHLPEGRLRKGLVIGQKEIAALTTAGISMVTVARLGPNDVTEDDAALALAQAVVPDPQAAGLELRAMGTGRVNILATRPGVVHVRGTRIGRSNAIDPMITLATVPRWQRMDRGAMVGTVKIIAYGVDRGALDRACALGAGALSLRAVQRPRVLLIQTALEPGEDGEKGHKVTAERVARLGGFLAPKQLVPHGIEPLAAALQGARDCDLILILTASATSDIHDTAPEALRQAGGRLIRFGMPVDPGNLLFLGSWAGRPVLGLPGCAKSPALNGADWVLERLMCGVPVTSAAIGAMGVGGLLKEIPSRPRPRE